MGVFNLKLILFFLIIISAGYLISKFPEESLLISGLAIIIIIGLWLHQAYQDKK